MESTIFTYSAEFMHALSWTLLHSVWQGFIVAMLLLTIVRLGKKLSATTKYISAIVSLVILFFSSIITFYLYLEIPTLGDKIAISESANWNDTIQLVIPQETSWSAAVSEFVSINSRLISLSWLIGLSFFILRILFGILQIQRLKNGRSNLSLFWIDKLEGLKQKVGYNKAILLGESANISSPITFGFLKPVLLFPFGMVNQLSVEQVEAIMAHELAHIIRKDYLINLIQTFIESIYYFNPSVWIISTIIRNQREHCCDDIAIELTGNNIHYIKALVAVEETKNSTNSILAMALAKNKKPLLNRVKRIMNQPQNNENMKEKLLMCIMLFISVLFFSMQVNPAEKTIKSTDSNQDSLSTNLIESDTDNPRKWVEEFADAYNTSDLSKESIRKNFLAISISKKGDYQYQGTTISKNELSKLMKDLKGEIIILEPHYTTKIEDVDFIFDLSMKYNIEIILSDKNTSDIIKFKNSIDELKRLNNTKSQIEVINLKVWENEDKSLFSELDDITLSWDTQGDNIQNVTADIIPSHMDYNTIHHFNDSVSFYVPKPDPIRVHPKLKSSFAPDTVPDYPGLHILDFDNTTITRSDEGLYWTDTDVNTSEDNFLTDELYAIMLLQNEKDKALQREMRDTTWNKDLQKKKKAIRKQAIKNRNNIRKEAIKNRKAIEKQKELLRAQKGILGLSHRDTLPQDYSDFIEGIKDSLALKFLIGKSTLGLELQDKLKLKNDLIREYSNEMRELALELQSEMQIEIEKAKEYQDIFENEIKIEFEEKMKDLHFELQDFLGDYNLGSRDKRVGDKTEGGFDELSMFKISRIDLIAQRLLEDGLIDDKDNFSFKFKKEKLLINKKQQPNSVYERYAKIIRGWAKGELSPNTKVQIVRKKGDDSFSIYLLD